MPMRNPNNSSEITSSTAAADCDHRPGGMMVQKREEDEHAAAAAAGSTIKIKVLHGSNQHDLAVPPQTTFGELKRIIGQVIGLEPQEQRLLFRGKEKDDEDCLQLSGVKDMSKIVLLEDHVSKERKLEQMKRDQGIIKACEAISSVSVEVDKLSERVSALQASVCGGKKHEDKEFVILTELLMTQLLKLDGINAEGEAKVQRKNEVRRIQGFVDILDALKARNSNPSINNGTAASVTTQWETFESGMGSLTAPCPVPPSTAISEDWERFD